jgi:hypothetical protein
MDEKKIKQIVFNIEHELTRIKAALEGPTVGLAREIDNAGERISSFGDMIRDAL